MSKTCGVGGTFNPEAFDYCVHHPECLTIESCPFTTRCKSFRPRCACRKLMGPDFWFLPTGECLRTDKGCPGLAVLAEPRPRPKLTLAERVARLEKELGIKD